MDPRFKNAHISNTFTFAREWRNGRRAGLRIRCRKAWGFKSPLSQITYLSIHLHEKRPAQLSLRRTFFSHADSNQRELQQPTGDQYPMSTDCLSVPHV